MKPENNSYQICTKCILDNQDDPSILFDEKGVCNYCIEYDKMTHSLPDKNERQKELSKIVHQIKKDGKGKKYDCVLGLSGGTDSSYMVYLCKELDIKPLIVHLDNGWNSELAVENIYRLIKNLDFDLYTHVIKWEEFRDIQLSYLYASVVDIEAITDHAIMAALYHTAKKYKTKYILSGANYAGEFVMIKNWVWRKSDWLNIKSMHQNYGKVKLKTFPYLNFRNKMYYHFIYKLQIIRLLDYVDYNPIQAKKLLIEKLGWKDYGGKHGESIFTHFYQNYILPKKFHIDKRKIHLSNLIWSGQITREQAIEECQKEIYTEKILNEEKEYVLKKLGLSEEQFEQIMQLPVRRHQEFDSDEKYYNMYFKLIKTAKKILIRN